MRKIKKETILTLQLFIFGRLNKIYLKAIGMIYQYANDRKQYANECVQYANDMAVRQSN